jgi:hypothetical protein
VYLEIFLTVVGALMRLGIGFKPTLKLNMTFRRKYSCHLSNDNHDEGGRTESASKRLK